MPTNVENFKLLYEQYMNAPRGAEESAIEAKMALTIQAMSTEEQSEAMGFVLELHQEADAIFDFLPGTEVTNTLAIFRQALAKWVDAEPGTDAKALASFAISSILRAMNSEEFATAMDYQRVVFLRIEQFDPQLLRTGKRSTPSTRS